MFLRIYLDVCALNRLFDDTSQARIRAESDAIQKFLTMVLQGRVEWLSSEIVETEILGNPDEAVRAEMLKLLTRANEAIIPSDAAFHRAAGLVRAGYGPFDALHLATAEEANADLFLTTDDRLLRRIRRGLGKPAVAVENPVDWTRKVKP